MRSVAMIIGSAGVLLTLAVAPVSPAHAADVPAYFNEIVGTETTTPGDVATKNVLQLNTTMFELYGDAGQIFRKNIRPLRRRRRTRREAAPHRICGGGQSAR
jgi:hypothetical protein